MRGLDRLLLENVSDIVSVIAEDGTIRYESPAVERILGWAPKELSGRDVLELIHPGDRARAEEAIGHVTADPSALELVRLRFAHRDGSWRHFECLGRRLPEGSWPGGIVVTSRDITDRREREAELQLMRSVLEAAANAVVIATREGEIEWVNRAFTEITGWEREDVIGRNPRILKSGAHDEAFYEDLWRTILSGGVWTGEMVNRRKDGSLYVEEQTITPVRRHGDEITHFVAIKKDITRRRRAEEELRRSEERFRALFEQSRDAIFMVATDLVIRDVNPAAERLLGYTREELRGRDGTRLLERPVEDRERFLATVTEGGVEDAGGGVEDFEVRVRTRDGTLLDCVVSAAERRAEDGSLVGYQGIVRDVTQRKRLEEQLRHLALHDWLTELPNPALFRDRLEHAVVRADRGGTAVALLFLDLDDFKAINDSLGHAAGDRVLVKVARRMEAAVRGRDTVARYGGDEFAVVLEKLGGPGDLDEPIRRLMERVEAPVSLADREITLGASVGVALHRGGEGPSEPDHTVEDLTRRADVAMYRAKEKVGVRYHVFDPAVDSDRRGLLERTSDLRRALDADEFEVVYQPVVRLDTLRPVGMEALARWHHPERGTLPPAEFIPLAEETGLILPLGELLLRKACGAAAGWRFRDGGQSPEGGGPGRPKLLFNLSARQLEDPELPVGISRVLEETGLEPSRLACEVTETALVTNPEPVDRLRRGGVSIVIDDFGTGYSSLRYLMDFRADALKIDMFFVQRLGRDPESDAIIRAITTLGETLGVRVIAEGVETEEQRRLLREAGCLFGQGFLFSHPVPARRVARLIA